MEGKTSAVEAAALSRIEERRSSKKVVIGSRKSDLAMWQARHVCDALTSAFPEYTFEIQTEVTSGDSTLDAHLASLAAVNPGVFTKELEVGLLAGYYDLAVHSLKDMPTTLPMGLELFGISEREDPRDVLVLSKERAETAIRSISELPSGWVIGTSSLRREALLRRLNPRVVVQTVRGNLNTRFRKLDASDADAAAAGHPKYDALLLAAAGVKRLGWWDRVSLPLEPSDWPYGVGQGALGLEGRSGDALIQQMCLAITDVATAVQCKAERRFLNKLQGGCQVPIGVHSHISAASSLRAPPGREVSTFTVTLTGTVLAQDGSVEISGHASEVFHSASTAPVDLWNAAEATGNAVGEALAARLLSAGAADILGPITSARPITYGSAEGPVG